MDGSEPRGSRLPGAGSGQEAASNAAGSGKPRGEHREAAGCRCGARVGASSGRKRSDGPKSRRDCCCCESSGSSARSLRRQSKVNNRDQLDWSQSHEDLMTMIQEMKKCLPEDKRSSSKPSTISALNYALQCVQQVQANKEFFQALNDRRVFQTDMMTYSIEELVTVASERTPKNSDTFVAVFSLLSGRIVHISKQAASILNCKKKVLDSSRFVELLAPQDVSVFYTHTDQSHLPLWNVENQTDSLFEYAQVKSFFCRIRGGKDQEQEKHCYPFRITPYLVHVCTSVHIDAESCCLALAEKIHSGYEAPRIPMEKRIFTTTHTPGCVFLEIDDRAVPLLGYLPQDLIGTSMLMYLHPEDRPLMIAVHRKILKFAGQSPFEHLPIRFCTQNGDYVILDTSWSSFVNPWSRKVVFIIGRHKVRTSPLNEDVFAARNKEASSVEKEIRELQGQIYKLLLQPVHSSISSGYDSLGSSGSYEHYISVSSSSDSNGNCADETQEPITLQQVCADVNRIKNLGQQLYIASWSKPQKGNEQAMSSEMLGGKRHSASCFLQRVRSDSTEEPGNILYDDSKRTPLVPSYQQINCVDSIIRYLESCSIPVLKRKCKSSTNTSSSSSDDDKKTQQTQQEFKALEVNSQTPVSADWEEMLKKQTTAGIVGAPLADLTLSNKSPSVVSATSQCSYSSTIVHVPHPQSEVTTMEDAAVGNEQMELPPVNALSLIMVPEELKPVGLTKETLSAHTQKEEQNYVDKFHQRILLSPFRTYLQQGSRSNNGHSCGQGDSPSLERSTASCKKGKHGKFKCQKPQRQSLDSHSRSKNRNSLPCEKRTIQKQSFFPSEVSCLSSSSMNVFPPVGFPVYSDSRSSFPASLVGEELALHSLKPEPTSLSQLCCEAPSLPALYPPNLGTFMAVFFHSYPMYSQLPQYTFLPSPQYIYPPSSYPCTTLPLAPPPAPSAVAPNSANQPFPASSATSTEEQQERRHDWALQLSSSRGSSPLQLNLLQEELPKPVEPSINTDVKAQAEAKCDNDPDGSGNSASSHCASSEFTEHQLYQDSQSGTGSAASGSGSALFSSLDFHSNDVSSYGTELAGLSNALQHDLEASPGTLRGAVILAKTSRRDERVTQYVKANRSLPPPALAAKEAETPGRRPGAEPLRAPRSRTGPGRRHGAARQPAAEGLPGRPRRDPFGPRRLRQPPLLPHRGGAQPARPGRQIPGAAGLPRPPAQRPRREGGGAQPGAAAALAGLRRAALPAGREAPGAGGVPAAAPHDGDGRREVAEAAESAGGRRADPRGGWLAAARRDGLRGAPSPRCAAEGVPGLWGSGPGCGACPPPHGHTVARLTALKCHPCMCCALRTRDCYCQHHEKPFLVVAPQL